MTQEANQASDRNIEQGLVVNESETVSPDLTPDLKLEQGLVVAESETVLQAITPDSSLDLTYGEIGQKVLSNQARVNLKAALVARLTIIQRLPFEGISDGVNLLTSGTGESVVVVQDRTGGMAITLTRLASLNNLLLPSDPKLYGITQREAISRYHEFLNVLFEQRLSGTMGSIPFIQSLLNIKAYFSALPQGYSGDNLIKSFYASLNLKGKKRFKGALIDSTLLNLIDTGKVLTHPVKYGSKLLDAAEDLISALKHDENDGYEAFLSDDESLDGEEPQMIVDFDNAIEEFANIWEELDAEFVSISKEGQEGFFRVIINGYSRKEASKVIHAISIMSERSDNDYTFVSTNVYASELRASISLNNERIRRRKEKEEKKKRKEESERRKIEEEAEKSLENPINPEAID